MLPSPWHWGLGTMRTLVVAAVVAAAIVILADRGGGNGGGWAFIILLSYEFTGFTNFSTTQLWASVRRIYLSLGYSSTRRVLVQKEAY